MNLVEIHLFIGLGEICSDFFTGVVDPVSLEQTHLILGQLEVESVQQRHGERASSFESPVRGEHPVEEWNDGRGHNPVKINNATQNI